MLQTDEAMTMTKSIKTKVFFDKRFSKKGEDLHL